MIQKLFIKNYAIIREIEIDFHSQLTVMTGETGAGKSIVLDALSLLLGARADSSVVLDENSKCIVEATFIIDKNNRLKEKLQERDFDIEGDSLILRREINSQGKSRAFINDTPCTLSELNFIQHDLIDINKQFDNQQIKNENYILNWVDIFAENHSILKNYSDNYKTYSSKRRELQELQQRKLTLEKEHDFIQFQIQEIQTMNLKENEIEQLEEQIKIIENQAHITKLVQESSFLLSESESNAIELLQRINSNFSQLSNYNSSFSSLHERLISVIEELKDINSEVSDNEISIEITESEFEEMNRRFSDAQRLLKKHGLSSTEELLNYLSNLESQNSDFESLDDTIISIESELITFENELKEIATELSKNRTQAIEKILPIFIENLQKVGLNTAEAKLELNSINNFNSTGCDEIEFLIDFNKTRQFLPLSKAGSGGELSRLLLAMKAVIGDKHDDTTFIFDEIDSAISGEVAKQVAILIKNISNKNQVIVLTHQPQMASKADVHYHLYKDLNEEKQRNETFIRLLDDEQRIQYIAQMMSGEEISEHALHSAKEMIENK